MDIIQSADISPNDHTEDDVNELQRIGFSPVVIKAIQDFIDGLQKLSAGCQLVVGGHRRVYFGTLLCVLGDTPAVQFLGGFKEGVGMAEKPCWTCEVSHADLSLHTNQFSSRDETEHRDRCDHLEQQNKRGKKYWYSHNGVPDEWVKETIVPPTTLATNKDVINPYQTQQTVSQTLDNLSS